MEPQDGFNSNTPSFCYICGIIGYGDKSYFNRRKIKGDDQGQQYSEFAKVKGNKTQLTSGISQTNQEYFKQFKNLKAHEDRKGSTQDMNQEVGGTSYK